MEENTLANMSLEPQLTNQLIENTKKLEFQLLARAMRDTESFEKVSEEIDTPDFLDVELGLIFKKTKELIDKGVDIDLTVVANELSNTPHVEKLIDVFTADPGTSADIDYFITQVKSNSQRRRLISLGQELIVKNTQTNGNIDGIIDTISNVVSSLFTSSDKEIKTSESISNDVVEQVKKMRENPHGVVGIPIGFPTIDYHLSGLHKTDLIILAARPARGKSSFALQIAKNVAIYSKTPVMFFSLEMGADQLMQRILASESRVELGKMRSGRVTDVEMEAITAAQELISSVPLYFNDKGMVSIKDIRKQLKAFNSNAKNRDNPIGLVIVDYLQLMAVGGGRENMVQAVTEISRGLKMIAKEFNVPVIALSQLSRGVEARGGEPRLSDLRDSGSIEQDADIVAFLHSEKTEDDSMGNKNLTFIVEKHRNGATFKQDLEFNGARMLFREITNFDDF